MWRELAHRLAQERLLRLLPRDDRIAQQLAGLLGQPRQHGRQVNGQLAEEVQPDRADVLRPCSAVFGSDRSLGQLPRLAGCSMYWLARSAAAMISRIALL